MKNMLAPGLYAIVGLGMNDEGRMVWDTNFADTANRNGKFNEIEDAPEGGFILKVDVEGTGHSVPTPFGPLSSSDLYAIVPVTSTETNFLPNIQYANNWIVVTIEDGMTITSEGDSIIVGNCAFSVADTYSADDCSFIDHPTPEYTLADVRFSIVDEEFEEITSICANDNEYKAITFYAGEPRLDYDIQHITIDDSGRQLLEELGTDTAKALIATWDNRDSDLAALLLRVA